MDQRTVANYTIAEASRCLGIPAATLRNWFKGQTKDGKQIVMNGNEVARLDQLLIKNNYGG